MKNKRRLTAMLLAGCLTVSSVPVAFAEDAPVQQQEQTTLTPEQQQEQVFALADQAREDSKAAAPTEGTCGENASWKLEGGTLTISGTGKMKDYVNSDSTPWDGSKKDVKTVIIEGGVTSIGYGAFSGCSSLTGVTIPDSITSIGDSAFKNCRNLTSVTIPDSVTSIRKETFFGCSGLNSVTIGNSVTSIGDSAFWDCHNLTNIIIPDSVTSIEGDVFYNCYELTGVTISNSVRVIGAGAFRDCSRLNDVTIPNGVRMIGEGAFSNTGYYNEESNWKDGILYCDGWILDAREDITAANITAGIRGIGCYAFSDCSSLTSVMIPTSVTIIGEGAFSNTGYYNEESNWNDGILYCDGWILNAREDITSVNIADETKRIGNSAFRDCSSLTSVTILNGITSIGDSAFWCCSSLTSVTISDSVTSIGCYAFSYCSSLNSVTIPNGVTSIEKNTFSNCSGLTSVTIGSGVTSIGSHVFEDCSGLTNVTIPDSVTSVGNFAFSGCSSLSSVTIGSGVTSIGSYAFYDCSGLTSVTIPTNVTSIGENAFDSSGLSEIYFTGDAPTIGDNVFYGVTATAYYPQDASGWENAIRNQYGGKITWKTKDYGAQEETRKGTCGENVFWELKDGTLTISGKGEMKDYGAQEDVPWYSSIDSIKKVVIGADVSTIGDFSLYGCKNLKSVEMSGIVIIGRFAFSQCTALDNITIPNATVEIKEGAFYHTGLTTIELPNSVENVGKSAFEACPVNKIKLSDHLSEISQYMFADCESITDIAIPDSVSTINRSAFSGCSNLRKIVMGSSISYLLSDQWGAASPFNGCGKLSEIYFTGDAPDIEDTVFNKITATAYYPQNAYGWENVIQNQYGGTITWTPWIPGETTETRQFQIGQDAWGFTNSTSAFGNVKEGYYITQADYDRLTRLLSNTDKENISVKKSMRGNLFGIGSSKLESPTITPRYNIDGKTSNHVKWIGSCYGMSTWACLTKDGVRKVSELGTAAENLHSVAFSPEVESAINYYQTQQYLRSSILAQNQFESLSSQEQLRLLETQVSDDKVAMIVFSWYQKFDKKGKPKKDSALGHAVVGYGRESGSWNKTINDRTDTYTDRILIYDCSRGEYDEEYDLYYNDSGIWCIPAYNIRSTSNEINDIGDNGCLDLVSNNKKVLNAVDYAQNSTKPYATENSQVVLATSSDNTYSVNWGSGSADIDGIIASNVSGTDRVNVIMETNITQNGTSEECSASAVLPEATEYTIESSEDGMSYQLENENYLTVAASEKSGTMKIQADGSAKIDTQEAGNYYISMTANDGYHELPWSTVEISGKDGKQISADMTDEGIIVSGDNLKDMTITGGNDDQTQEVTVSTDKSDVLISSDNGDISVKQDSDGDGKYETDIVKPNPKPTTPVTEIFSDIYPSAWYIDYVQFVYDNGLMTGTSKTTFEPETTLSRAMVAQVLYNYDKRVDSPYRATNGKTFKDVSKNDWFYEAIQWASANGIASGVGNGYFEPNSPVTREQVAQFLYNYNGRPSVSGNLPFSDADKVSGWAKNAMLWAYQNKIINGTTSPDGGLLLDPQGGATRAQAAAILTNYMRNMM